MTSENYYPPVIIIIISREKITTREVNFIGIRYTLQLTRARSCGRDNSSAAICMIL